MRVRQRALLMSAAFTSLALAAAAPYPAAAADQDGQRRVQVVMVNFTDSAFKDPAKTKAALQEVYFGEKGSLTSYYNEVSQGATTFEPGAGDGGVLDTVDLPMAGSGCDSGKIYNETIKALEQRGMGWDDFQHLSIVFPNDTAQCGFGGLGSVGGGITWVPVSSDGGSADKTVLVHEFGHNFGYQHQMRFMCTGPDLSTDCKGTETTSHKTPMGGGTDVAGLTAPELMHAKWLSTKEAPKVTKSHTYTLRSLYGEGDGVRALDIPLGEDRLVVELRGASENLDKGIKGVHAYRVSGGNYAASSLVDITPDAHHWAGTDEHTADSLPAGTVLTDKAHKVEVKVLKSAAGEATVAVSLDGVPAPSAVESSPADDPNDPAPQTGDSEPTASTDTQNDADLAATGGDSDTSIPLAVGGGLLLAVGGVFVSRSVSRRIRSAPRHSR